MSNLLLDDITGDLAVIDNRVVFSTGLAATKQRIRSKLRLFLGEWFLDRTKGIPYKQQVFIKNPNPTIIDAIFKRAVSDDPAVTKITKWEFDVTLGIRELKLNFSVQTLDGPIDFFEVLGV